MKFHFESSWRKRYVELLPTITFGWWAKPTLYFGWLFWSITVEDVLSRR